MAHIHIPSDIPVRFLPRAGGLNLVFGAMMLVGAVAFVLTLGRDPDLAWQSYVVNWNYFTSLAVGAVMTAVATWIVKAKWNWSVRRISLAFVAFLPISFILLLPLLVGLRENYFPWMEMMAYDYIVQKKAAYLNIPFLVTRIFVGVLVMFGLMLGFAYLALRPDMGLSRGAEGGDSKRASWRDRLSQGWTGQEQEEVRSYSTMTKMAPAVAMVFAVVMSVVSFDFAMSLEPHWFSTLFGAWFFMGAFWGGWALTSVTTVWAKSKDPVLDEHMGKQQLWDLGKLTFAFTVFWTYLFWSQYIVIWYGKLPWEQAWVIHRAEAPWGAYSLAVLFMLFIIPFAGLLGRKPKMTPALLATFSSVILVGQWLWHYVLIFPSLHDGGPTFSIWTPAIGLLFLGAFLMSARWFLSTFPVIQVWQPMVDPESVEAEVAPEVPARA